MIVSDKLCRHVIFWGPISWWFMCLIVYHCWSYTYESYTYSLYNLMGSQASSSEADEACWGNNPDLLEKLGVDTWGFPARHGGPQGSPKMLGVSGEISSFEMDVDKGKSWGVPSFEQCPSSSCWLMLVGSGIIHYPSSIGDSFHTPRTRNPEKNAAQYDGTIFRDDWGYIPMIPMAFRNIWTSVRLALHPKGNSPRLLTLDPHHPNLPIYIISIHIYIYINLFCGQCVTFSPVTRKYDVGNKDKRQNWLVDVIWFCLTSHLESFSIDPACQESRT